MNTDALNVALDRLEERLDGIVKVTDALRRLHRCQIWELDSRQIEKYL